MRKLILTAGTALATAMPALVWPLAASAAESGGIEEIIVTAQRREETAQKAALAIQAISGAELAKGGVSRPEDLSKVATGVQIGTGAQTPQIYIRGVGNYSTNNYAEGAVALNIDGVYVSRGWGSRGEFYDLDRVEVLKGPQGTLYGRNASGGAINLITARPQLGKFGGYIEGEVGNFDLAHGTAAINIPIGQTVAVRLSGNVMHRNGYNEDGTSDDKSQAGRLAVLYKPNSVFSLLLNGTYHHLGGRGVGYTPMPTLAGTSPWLGIASPEFNGYFSAIDNAPGGIGTIPGPHPPFHTVFIDKDSFALADLYTLSAEMNWDLGPVTLTVIPAYRTGSSSYRFYVPQFQVTGAEYDHQTSVETRFSHQTDRLKWVAGLYYFDERQGNRPDHFIAWEDGGFFSGETQGPLKTATQSFAGFGQATYSVVPSFRVTAGLRYTFEHKIQGGIDDAYQPAGPGGCAPNYAFNPSPLLPQTPCVFERGIAGRLNFYNISYKAGIEYDLAPRSLLYLNYSTGFKSGGFTYATTPTFKPERLNAWEFGVKNRFFNNRLQANVELFYWRYLNHQENHLGPAENGTVFTFITENAGVAKSYGVLVDLAYQPTASDKFTLGVQWNPTTYSAFQYTYPTGATGGHPPETGCELGPLTGAGIGAAQTVNCANRPIVRAPLWTGNAGYAHDFDLKNGGVVTAGVSAEFATGSYLGIEFLARERQQAWYMLDSDLTYTAPDGKWSVSAWGRNLNNAAVFNDTFPAAFYGGISGGTIRAPRMYGVRARLNF